MSNNHRPIGVDAGKLDSNMTVQTTHDDSLRWLSPLEQPFHIAGFAWFALERKYRRLPVASADAIPPAVDKLADCTTGGQIRFLTYSSRLSIRVKLAAPANMYHMPATGQCGFDCYVGEHGNQRYLSTTRFDHTQPEYEAPLFDWNEKREVHVTLNFPLYQGVEEVWIGVDPDAKVGAPETYASTGPIVVYGTSITQGGCASRPGMAYTNVLSRSLPYEFINLGFSGNGRGEPEVARIIASIENPALYVLDYEANTGTVERMADTLPTFIQILRERHPTVPILVVSKIKFAKEHFFPDDLKLRLDRLNVQRSTVERLQAAGDANVHFLDGGTLLGDSLYEECTVDGVHPTDLGFYRMAESLEPVIRSLLEG
ncbi:hypothetical protein SK3146_02912 [Paenibacillus konkukensis]|uniref:Lysophospholipase L1 n=1 Tax=Paenibacillus konkukensis TaxID=2020716 RepID=A0ABY4RNX0_9BACL|nr:SGNH/GDSL hydrolase family protein [Paenibacillus konkukensis]UQZ83705.1 hypothetical protein SK3146_02912 [Paenibacillus konkukensis]